MKFLTEFCQIFNNRHFKYECSRISIIRHFYNMTSPIIFRKVDSVLNTLNTSKNVDGVTALLDVYTKVLKAKQSDDERNPNAFKYPLIVLEGLDGCGKSTVTTELVKLLNAVKWTTPPESIKHIRPLFDDHKELRTAYYALGNYIAGLECSVILKQQPVVMDRYWHSTTAYAIAQAVHDSSGKIEMPPASNSFYQWPDDLMKPDKVFFLNVDENVRLQRLSRRTVFTNQEKLLQTSKQFRDNVILAYRNMINPEVIFVESNSTVKEVASKIQMRVSHLLK